MILRSTFAPGLEHGYGSNDEQQIRTDSKGLHQHGASVVKRAILPQGLPGAQ